MKILIVGTGVIGSLYGKALSEKHDVTHFVRKNKFDELNEKTVNYDIIDERFSDDLEISTGKYSYKCTTTASDTYDLVIVPVNLYQLDSVLETLTTENPNNKYLIFTLNWDGTDTIQKYLSDNQYIMGYPGGGGTFKDNLLYGNIGKDITIGSTSPHSANLLEIVNNIFTDCDFLPETSNEIIHWLWIHNVGTVPTWAGVYKYKNIDEFFDDKELFQNTYLATKECFEICKKRGVDLSSYAEVEMYNMPCETIYEMMKTNFKTNPVMERYTSHALKSFDEMKYNFNLIYNTGKSLNVTMPCLDYLYTLIYS